MLALCGACASQERDDVDPDDPLPLAAAMPPEGGMQEAGVASVDAATTAFDTQTLRGVSGLYDAEIQASGSGCPVGTTAVTADDDGQTFSVRFAAFRLTIDPSTATRTADCTLQLRLRSMTGLTFLYDVLSVQGRAVLPEGVRARVAARLQTSIGVYPTAELQAPLAGPLDGPFRAANVVRLADPAYTPCGLSRDFVLNVRVHLFNAERAVSGEVSLGADDADPPQAIRFRLRPRPCTPLAAARPDGGR